jgi:hypothetical protein
LCFDLTSCSLVAIVVGIGNQPYITRVIERTEQMFVLSDEIKAQVTQLREVLEEVAMREDIHERQSAWLFALCETLGEISN